MFIFKAQIYIYSVAELKQLTKLKSETIMLLKLFVNKAISVKRAGKRDKE